MAKHSKPDHKFAQPTTQESLLHDKIREMRAEFELRMLNVVAQLRAVTIAAKISPTQFLETFHNDDKQNKFFQELNVIEKDLLAKKALETQKTNEELNKFQMPETEELKEAILGKGDRIN